MEKRIKGNGCIYQLDKGEDGKKPRGSCRKWRLVVSIGKDARTGKYRQKAKNFNGSYTQAKRALREFIVEIERGDAPHSDWTFNDFAKYYVDTRVMTGEVQDRTVTYLRASLKALGHHIGGLQLYEITPESIEAAYHGFRSGDTLSGKPLSNRTVYNIAIVASQMFKYAKEKGIVASNPFDEMTTPRKGGKEKKALSATAYRKLLYSLDPTDSMQCAVLLCAALGLRRSEAIGLSWGDVDFAEGIVNVHTSSDDHSELKEPKTQASRRLLPLPPFLVKVLMQRKESVVLRALRNDPEETSLIRVSAGARWSGCVEIDEAWYDIDPQMAIACTRAGNRLKPNSLSKWWRSNRGKFGLDDYTLHELRHSFLSRAAAQGIHPSVMMRLAGHANPGVTMKIYTHVNIEQERKAMEIMQEAYMTERQDSLTG